MPQIKRPNSSGLRPSDVRPSKQPNMATTSASVSTRAEDSVVRQRRTTPAAPPTGSAPLAPQRPAERDPRMAISRVLHRSDAPAIPQYERQLLERGPAGALSSVRTAMPADTSHAAGASAQTYLPPGGALALQVQQLGYSPAQMERAVKNYNPTGIYSAIVQHTRLLRGLGLSLDDIVKVVGGGGGAQALDGLSKHGPGLLRTGYSRADVVKMAANNGGAQALAALGRHGPQLLWQGYTQGDVVKVAQRAGGAQALEALGKHGPVLLQLGYTKPDMVRVAGNIGGAQALDALGIHSSALLHLGYTHAEVVNVAGNSGGTKALAALEKSTPTLLAHGYRLSELATIGAISGSAQKLSLITEHAGAIRTYRLTRHSIIQQATRLRSFASFQTWLLQQFTHG